MKVVVIPKRPIPGILPKNKWIDTKMVLDLNRNEIKHCMQYGSVFDESGNLIDSRSIQNIPAQIIKEAKPVEEPIVVTSNPIPEPVVEIEVPEPIVEEVPEPEVVEETPVVEEAIEEEPEESPYYNLEVVSYETVDDYIVMEVEMDTNSKLEGNLYGLFSAVSNRPTSIEYQTDNGWVKFSTKFANFTSISNGDRFVFRFIPKNELEFTFRLLVKESNNVLASLEGSVNPSEL